MDDYPTQTEPVAPNSTKLIVNPGTYSVGVRGDLTVTDHVEVEIAERREMDINVRAKRHGELTNSTRVNEPDLEYMWFTEEPNEVYVSGISEEATWAHALDYTVTGDTPEIFSFDETAEKVSSVKSNFNVGDVLTVNARASIRGQVHVHLAEGVNDLTWVPAANLELRY